MKTRIKTNDSASTNMAVMSISMIGMMITTLARGGR
jgi:hypothetical protein